MRNLFFLFCLTLLLMTCDDGDIITVELDFDQELQLCAENTEDFLVYDIRTDPAESLSLIFPRTTATTAYFTTVSTTEAPHTFEINGNTIRFNYRTYNVEPTFCNIISDPNIVINEDYEALAGTVNIITTIIDSDNDGISNENENEATGQDTDSDGIPDYIDQDDDNDNVLTKDEDDNSDGDNDPFTNPLDTDGDTIANYLDTDDDGDGVPTQLEDEDENTNPTNDFQESNDGSAVPPRYLDDSAAETFADSGLRSNSFTRTITMAFTILNAGLEIINTDLIDFGTYTILLSN